MEKVENSVFLLLNLPCVITSFANNRSHFDTTNTVAPKTAANHRPSPRSKPQMMDLNNWSDCYPSASNTIESGRSWERPVLPFKESQTWHHCWKGENICIPISAGWYMSEFPGDCRCDGMPSGVRSRVSKLRNLPQEAG
jgi:hypothetical protein